MSLKAVNPFDHAERIAVGLETLAADIRYGRLPQGVRKCLVVVTGPDALGPDALALCYYGAEASLAESLGMLELAKYELIQEARE